MDGFEFFGSPLEANQAWHCSPIVGADFSFHSMAICRSLFFFSPPICSQPAAAAAIERIKVHLLHNANRKLHTSLFNKAAPWIPRRFQFRHFSRELVQFASTRASDPQCHVEASPSEEPSGEEEGGEFLISEPEPTKKPSRRRRRIQTKVEEETGSSNVLQKEAKQEAVAVEGLTSTGVVPTVEANFRELGINELSLEPDMISRENVDSATETKSSSTSSPREVPKAPAAGKAGGEVTSILWTEELEKAPVQKEKKMRTRKPKEAGPVSNGTVSAISASSSSEVPKAQVVGTAVDTGWEVTSISGTEELEEAPVEKVKSEKKRRTRKPKEAVAVSNGTAYVISAKGTKAEQVGRIFTDGDSINETFTRPENAPEESLALETITSVASEGSQSNGEETNCEVVTKKKGRSKKKVAVHPERRQPSKRREVENSTGSGVDLAVSEDSMSNDNSRSEEEEQAGSPNGPGSSKTRKRRGRRMAKGSRSKLQGTSQTEVIVPCADDLYESIVWCTVHLKVQAELEETQRLYVVGANPELGGWDLSQALPLPESDEEGVWENTLKIPRGTMLEYKFFTESQDSDSAVIERWFGPEILYFLPWKEGVGSEFEVIRDMWIPDVSATIPLLPWGERWWEDMDSIESNEDLGADQAKDVVGYNQDFKMKRAKVLDGKDQQIDSEQIFNSEDEVLDGSEKQVQILAQEPIVEEWLKKKIRKKVFPVEEPWLLESMIIDQRNGSARKKNEDAVERINVGTESVVTEQKGHEVQVEILINSPQCTMQRMAIIEDGKLAELLIEPMNTRIQVGNVYLGVVRQLLPGMTGVFVDIGGFQLALLDITRNQYPYTFPSIGQSTHILGDGQSLGSSDEDEKSDGEEFETGDEDKDDDEDDRDSNFVDDEEGDEGELDEEVEDDASRGRSTLSKGGEHDTRLTDEEANEARADSKGRNFHSLTRTDSGSPGPITVNFGRKLKKWKNLQEGMQIIVQVKKEPLGKKGPRLTAFPSLAGRFWVLIPGGNAVGVSQRITGPERKRLRELAQNLLPPKCSLTVRTEALGHDREELEKDLSRLMETWKEVLERASAAAVAAEHGMEGAMPVLLHRAMRQFLTIVRDFFNDKVHRMMIDSPQCYQEVTSYLQEVAPQLSDRVELYTDKIPIFDAFDIESEIEKFSNRRVSLPNGGYLVMEETEALVSIDVNGGTGVLSHDFSQEEAILAVNLAAARQIAKELRLRDIGGIIVVDFIDMEDSKSEKMVLDEMRKATARDRSSPSFSEISEFGLMEMTRKRVRPSVTLTISDPCSHCGGVGRVEAHETTLSKIEREVLRLLATRPGDTNSSDSTKWPQLSLRVDHDMGEYLKGRKRRRMTQLSADLKVWLNLKVVLEFPTGKFQVLQQHRMGSEKRPNGAGQTKSNLQNIGPGLLGKRAVWPGKRRRTIANQGSTKD